MVEAASRVLLSRLKPSFRRFLDHNAGVERATVWASNSKGSGAVNDVPLASPCSRIAHPEIGDIARQKALTELANSKKLGGSRLNNG